MSEDTKFYWVEDGDTIVFHPRTKAGWAQAYMAYMTVSSVLLKLKNDPLCDGKSVWNLPSFKDMFQAFFEEKVRKFLTPDLVRSTEELLEIAQKLLDGEKVDLSVDRIDKLVADSDLVAKAIEENGLREPGVPKNFDRFVPPRTKHGKIGERVATLDKF
jgi:hypothetical protein